MQFYKPGHHHLQGPTVRSIMQMPGLIDEFGSTLSSNTGRQRFCEEWLGVNYAHLGSTKFAQSPLHKRFCFQFHPQWYVEASVEPS